MSVVVDRDYGDEDDRPVYSTGLCVWCKEDAPLLDDDLCAACKEEFDGPEVDDETDA
jgi:predicted amidophosphoribosyltransferase